MGAGWLTPNSIRQADGSWKIKSDGDLLIPVWEFPNKSGKVLLDTDGVTTVSGPQSLTIATGVIAPTLPASIIGEIRVTGEGDADDNLTTITAGTTFTGKILLVRKAGAGTITVKQSASILMRTDCTLNHVNDLLVLIWSAANVWVEMTRYTYD